MPEDPFGEHEASITPLPDKDEAAVFLQSQDAWLAEGSRGIPTNPIPFNEMAAYFGAAGTIFNRLCNREVDYVTAESLYKEICDVWRATNGQEFCDKVMGIILQYYAGHTDHRAWEAATKARAKLLGEGYGGMGRNRIMKAASEAAEDPEVGKEAAELARRLWFFNT